MTHTHLFCRGCRNIQRMLYQMLPGTDVSGQYADVVELVCERCATIGVTMFKERDI